jgi:hypothetical protein
MSKKRDSMSVRRSISSRVLDQDRLYSRHFAALSTRDLLDARDAYHVHLAHKENVIATAIGLYLIRRHDPDANDAAKTHEAAQKRGQYSARTLENSVVRPWSWPCVLVFVSNWQMQSEIDQPEHVVPPFLYLDDGRVVPVCVVLANHSPAPPASVPASRLETDTLSGGSPIFVKAQGQIRAGSVGCIVTDGSEYYALTNHHVAGEAGRPILASFRGIGKQVGTTVRHKALATRSFSDVYPTLPGRDTRVNIDAGLVHIDDVSQWSPSLKSLGTLGRMLDFSADTASLDWIGTDVVAHGAVSGDLKGTIRALFYRYASIGGREFVTDFLIAPRDGETKASKRTPPMTKPGDSGTVWCVEAAGEDPSLRPLALQWGGQKLGADASRPEYTQFALASSLAIVCRELELDLVTAWTDDRPQYWGAVGHFKIGQQACFRVEDGTLKKFLQDNLDNISFADEQSLEGATSLKADSFVPLSDVPDVVWKTNVNRVDRSVTRPTENTNHYADMDLPGDDGHTLLDLCGEPPQLDVDAWREFYASAPPPKDARPGKDGQPAKVQQGCLPFRVWQVFSAMQGYAKDNDAESFLCAAGILAHYVGDSCQPLHGSQHSDGLYGAQTGVHSTYEDNMVEAYATEIGSGIDQAIASGDLPLLTIGSGKEAGGAVVDLIRRSQATLSPETICESYNRVHGGFKSPTKSKAVLDAMWADCGQGTISCIADGIRVLASMWESAFGAATDKEAFAGAIDSAKLRATYSDKTFLPSRLLSQFTEADLPGASASPRAKTTRSATTTKATNGARKHKSPRHASP